MQKIYINTSIRKIIKFLRYFCVSILILIFCFCFLVLFFNGLIFKNLDLTGWDRMIFARRDLFYVGATGDNWYQIPVIEPYYVVQDSKGSGDWRMNLILDHNNQKDILYNHSAIIDIWGFAVEKRVIMLYTDFNPLTGKENKNFRYTVTPWYVIIPDRKIETGFENEEDFLHYIHNLGIYDPKWVYPEVAIHKFWETECLYWIPDCSK